MLLFIFEYPSQSVEPGEQVITSGFDNSIYPRGLLIGTISTSKKDKFGKTIAKVKPAVEFSKIEDVLILLKSSPVNTD